MEDAQPPSRAPRPRHRRGVQVKADNLRNLRQRTGIPVRAFAKQVGISTQHMYNLENGWKTRISPEAAQRIANQLQVDYEQIVEVAA